MLTNAYGAEPIRIGLSLGLTGRYQAPAKMQAMGYRLWETHVNQRGGLLGHPVFLNIWDDQSNSKRALKVYKSFVSTQQVDQPVDMVFGPYSSTLTKAVASTVDWAGYPMIAAGAAASEIWEDKERQNIFAMDVPASRFAVGMLELAALKGLLRAAIIYPEDEFSTDVVAGTERYAKVLGLDLVLVETIRTGAANMATIAKKCRDQDAQLIIVAGRLEESISMRQAFEDMHWYPQAYFATIGPALPAYRDRLGTTAEGTFGPSLWEPSVNFPGSKEFLRAFLERYGIIPSYHAAEAYAAGEILEKAIKQAKSQNRKRIREALFDLDVYTLIGRYKVDRTGMQLKRFPLVIQWQKGRKEVVWPEEVRTAKAKFGKQ